MKNKILATLLVFSSLVALSQHEYKINDYDGQTITACDGILVDDGGQGHWSNSSFYHTDNKDYTTTVCNPNPTDSIYLTLFSFKSGVSGQTSCPNDRDLLNFYSGTDINGTCLFSISGKNSLSNFCDVNNPIQVDKLPKISAALGCITVKWHSDCSNNAMGYEIAINCERPTYDSYNTASVACDPSQLPANDVCSNAPEVSLSSPICGSTLNTFTPESQPSLSSWCENYGASNKSSWLSFIADTSYLSLQLFVDNCSGGTLGGGLVTGVQMQIFETTDCSNFTQKSNCLSPGALSGTGMPLDLIGGQDGYLVVDNLVAGNKYYILIGGYYDDVCDYTIVASHITPCAPIDINFVTQNETCTLRDGRSTATATGGTAPYTYAWAMLPPQTGVTATGLTAGTYTVGVVDNKSCTATATTTVGFTPSQSLTVTTSNVTNNNTCQAGGCNGSITANPSGGTPAYTYAWTGGATTATAGSLCAGSYTVTATDSKGCFGTVSASISNIGSVDAGFTYTPACLGNPVQFTNTGSTGTGVTYSWNFGDGSALSTLQNPTHTYTTIGNYTASQTVTLGTCTDTYSTMVIASSSPTLTIDNVRHATCNKICDGIINVSVNGGVEPYTYLWDNGIRTHDKLRDLCAGNYTVSVTDANGCTSSQGNIVVWEPDPIVPVVTVVPASCNRANGEASVSLTGGCGHFGYQWKSGNNPPFSLAPNVNGLTSGLYHLVITDICEYGGIQTICELNDPIAVIIHEEGTPKLEGEITNVSCNRQGVGNLNVDDNGSITLTISEGKLPYDIQWNNGERDAYITHLTAGTYTVTVTDDNDCEVTSQYTITEPNLLEVSLSSMVPVGCYGGKDGQLRIRTTGGTWFNGKNHYTYLWDLNSTVNTDSSMYDLVAGRYSVTATDANNCIDTFSYRVTQPTAMQISVLTQDIGCNGEKNGSANISVIGGTPAYKYSWNSKANVPNKANLKAGNYVVTVTDANNCYDTISFNILESSKLNVVLAKNTPDYCERADGIIELVSYGGTAPYTYDWIPNVGITDKIVNLESGNYKITVTDSRNCSYDTIVTIESKPCPLEIPNVLSPNSDGANDVFCIKYIEQYKNVKLVIFNRWGNEIINYNNYEEINNWDGRTQTGAEVTDGVYFYIITLNDGVTFNGSVTVIR